MADASSPPAGGGQRGLTSAEFKVAFAGAAVVYPCYIDEALTVSQGRRVPRSACAGCTPVNIFDVFEAAAALGFSDGLTHNVGLAQAARHPRCDPFTGGAGRVHVRLRDATGAPVVPGVETKEALLRALARVIPTLESRRARNAQWAAMRDAAMRDAARALSPRAAAPALPDAAPAAGGGKGKGGKKR
jgi:signal recognition particle subunit SEC65